MEKFKNLTMLCGRYIKMYNNIPFFLTYNMFYDLKKIKGEMKRYDFVCLLRQGLCIPGISYIGQAGLELIDIYLPLPLPPNARIKGVCHHRLDHWDSLKQSKVPIVFPFDLLSPFPHPPDPYLGQQKSGN